MKPIYAIVWTWQQNRIVKTKKRGTEVMRVWKKWYERQGWKVQTCGPDAYIATSPEGVKHAIVLHVYDAETKTRIHRAPKTRAAPKAQLTDESTPSAANPPAPRRGRSTASCRSTPAWA